MARMLIGKVVALALCGVIAALSMGGCSTGPPAGLSKAERWVGVVQTGVTSLRDAEHQIVVDATAAGDAATAAKAAKIEKAAAQALPYLAIAKDGLAAARGDPAAQARVLTELVTKIGGTDPSIVAIASIIPPLIQELISEAQSAAPSGPAAVPRAPPH